ncbi:uncharacterized protein PG986_000482 [Apiospora aurea]|uniref:F-box domain-containing protein n=1 Tax=Apiospora aurea TaxID=335848 RepID=A0ABR1QU49_9PEZI
MQPPAKSTQMGNLVLDGKEHRVTSAPGSSLPVAENTQVELAHPAGQVSRLEALPEELVLNIFRCTPHESFACLSQASRTLRRISKSPGLRDYHEWQDEMLQACWGINDDRSRISPGLGGLRAWFTDSDDNRSALGQQLRKDLFCAGCQQPPSSACEGRGAQSPASFSP